MQTTSSDFNNTESIDSEYPAWYTVRKRNKHTHTQKKTPQIFYLSVKTTIAIHSTTSNKTPRNSGGFWVRGKKRISDKPRTPDSDHPAQYSQWRARDNLERCQRVEEQMPHTGRPPVFKRPERHFLSSINNPWRGLYNQLMILKCCKEFNTYQCNQRSKICP